MRLLLPNPISLVLVVHLALCCECGMQWECEREREEWVWRPTVCRRQRRRRVDECVPAPIVCGQVSFSGLRMSDQMLDDTPADSPCLVLQTAGLARRKDSLEHLAALICPCDGPIAAGWSSPTRARGAQMAADLLLSY